MSVFRSTYRLLHIVCVALVSAAALVWAQARARGQMTLLERARWMQTTSRRALRSFGIQVQASGNIPARGVVVSNHISYLDIFLLASLAPCVFVSKKEVSRWPLLGWLVRGAGTLFIDRTRKADSQKIGDQMIQALQSGACLVFFPEGTTSPGIDVQRFHSSLFEYPCRSKSPVTAAAIAYIAEGADETTEVAYWGDMSILPHFIRLSAIRRIRGEVIFAPHSKIYDDRRKAAADSQSLVSELHDQLQQQLGRFPSCDMCKIN